MVKGILHDDTQQIIRIRFATYVLEKIMRADCFYGKKRN